MIAEYYHTHVHRYSRSRTTSAGFLSMPSELQKGSRASVASIGFNHTGGARRRIFLRASAGRMLNNELGITSILEEELQVFCVESKLVDRSANLVGKGSIGGSPGPAIAAACVLELQLAAVDEIQRRLIERPVHHIASDFILGVLREVHRSSVAKVG
jgi:hypothetical protein